MPPYHFSKIRFNRILSSMPGSSKSSPSLTFYHQNPSSTSSFPHTCYLPSPCHSSWFDHPKIVWWGV
jgi:hypothetical protein